MPNRWMMDDLKFYILFISISVIWVDDNEKLYAIEPIYD